MCSFPLILMILSPRKSKVPRGINDVRIMSIKIKNMLAALSKVLNLPKSDAELIPLFLVGALMYFTGMTTISEVIF